MLWLLAVKKKKSLHLHLLLHQPLKPLLQAQPALLLLQPALLPMQPRLLQVLLKPLPLPLLLLPTKLLLLFQLLLKLQKLLALLPVLLLTLLPTLQKLLLLPQLHLSNSVSVLKKPTFESAFLFDDLILYLPSDVDPIESVALTCDSDLRCALA